MVERPFSPSVVRQKNSDPMPRFGAWALAIGMLTTIARSGLENIGVISPSKQPKPVVSVPLDATQFPSFVRTESFDSSESVLQ